MNFPLSSIIKQREESTLSSVENHRRLRKESLSIDDKDNINECNYCSKIFTSEYGLHYHINMHHSSQSILCSDCNILFRSHRTLKTHQQRFHRNSSRNLPDYNYISSYLVVAFSAQQFPLITKIACEQGHLPLGGLTSKLFQCKICSLSFPCSKALKYHLLNQHEQYEYNLCMNILHEIILEVEQNFRTVTNDEENVEILLSKQASHFGLVNKQLALEYRSIKQEQNRQIFPSCQHRNPTCANLCLEYLSEYNKLIQNYSYQISLLPKGNPFAQGSIVAKPMNTSSVSKEGLNINQKRVKSSVSDDLSLPPSKKKLLGNNEQQFKASEIKSVSASSTPRKVLPKMNRNYARSLSSMSSNSSTSSRISSKNSRQQAIISLKRSLSPTITLAVERSSEKRRRQREQRKAKSSSLSTVTIKIDQENDDDDTPDLTTISKPRQASNSSVEYVQILTNDQQSISSLNNIENLKLKSDEEILICHSSSPRKKVLSSPNKTHSKTTIHKVNGHQTSDYDEHIRVRCKICGDILEGRSLFSKHVLTMHSHLVKNNMSDMNQQQTTIVR